MPKKKSEVVDNTKILEKGILYDSIKGRIKKLESELKEPRKFFDSLFESAPFKEDGSGSKEIIVEDGPRSVKVLWTARTILMQDPEIIQKAQKLLPEEVFNEVVENIPTFRTDVFERLLTEGVISDDIAAKLFEEKVTHSLTVKAKFDPIAKA